MDIAVLSDILRIATSPQAVMQVEKCSLLMARLLVYWS